MKVKVHWNIFEGKWTVRNYKSCARHEKVLIVNGWKTETKPNYKDNPRGWVYSDHKNVIVDPSEEMLKTYRKKGKLMYDKKNVSFNIDEGDVILFDDKGAFVVEQILN